MNKNYRVKVNADLFLKVEAEDNIQARNQVLAILDKYKKELNVSINAIDTVEEE